MAVKVLLRGALVLLAAVAAACGTQVAKVPTFQITVVFDDGVMLDQLRFEVVRGTTQVVAPAVRPLVAAGPIVSGASVAMILPDSAVGKTVSVRVTGMLAGTDVISGRADDLAAFPDRSVDVTVRLGRQLTSITLNPNSLSTPIGQAQQVTAQGVYSDGTIEDVTDSATWTTNDANLVGVDNTAGTRGLVTGKAIGTAVVSAALNGQSADCRVTVTAVRLLSISITPNPLLLPLGAIRGLKATATYSDRSTADVTDTVAWATTDPNIATVGNAAGSRGIVSSVAVGSVSITATDTKSTITGMATVAVVVPALTQILVEPTNSRVAAGFTRRFFATGIYTDGSREDLTSSVNWSTSDGSKATISNVAANKGELAALMPATIQVIADKGAGSNKVTGQIDAVISAATLSNMTVTPVSTVVPKGSVVRYVATGTYSDGSTQDLTTQVTWAVTPSSLAAIDNVTQHGAADTKTSTMGTGTVTATLGPTTASTQLTVSAATLQSIMVSPVNPMIAKGTNATLKAVGTYSDGSSLDISNQVTWTANPTSIATVAGGVVTGQGVGNSTITASFATKSGATLVTVTTATLQTIAITPSAPSLAAGTNTPLMATGIYSDGSTQDLTTDATWTTADGAIATIGNSAGSQGLLTAKTPGSVQITATAMGVGGKVTATVTQATLSSVAVTPTNPGLPNGTAQVFHATGSYSGGSTQDLTAQVTWSSSATSIAQISNATVDKGTAQGLALGPTTITATITVGTVTKSGSTTLTVTDAVLNSITITPVTPAIALGTSLRLRAIAHYSDNTTKGISSTVSWSSSAETVAPVSNGTDYGTVSGLVLGTATIKAKLGTIEGTTLVTVTAAALQTITILPDNDSVVVGTTEKLTATGHYSDASTQDLTTQVTWASSDDTIAPVSNASGSQGQIKALAAGTVTVKASYGVGATPITGTTLFTGRAITLVSLQINPGSTSVAAGLTTPFTALGTYSNSTTQDITKQVNWSSSDDSMGTVSNADPEQGIATGIIKGSVTITAALNGVMNTATLTITDPVLQSISLGPDSPSVAVAATTPLTATGHYSDFTSKPVTDAASWTSMDETLATVDDVTTKGLCTGVAMGTVTIRATVGTVFGEITLTVTP